MFHTAHSATIIAHTHQALRNDRDEDTKGNLDPPLPAHVFSDKGPDCSAVNQGGGGED